MVVIWNSIFTNNTWHLYKYSRVFKDFSHGLTHLISSWRPSQTPPSLDTCIATYVRYAPWNFVEPWIYTRHSAINHAVYNTCVVSVRSLQKLTEVMGYLVHFSYPQHLAQWLAHDRDPIFTKWSINDQMIEVTNEQKTNVPTSLDSQTVRLISTLKTRTKRVGEVQEMTWSHTGVVQKD